MYEEQNYSVHEKVTLNYNHYYIFTPVLAPKESHLVVFVPLPGWRKRGESTVVFLPPSALPTQMMVYLPQAGRPSLNENFRCS